MNWTEITLLILLWLGLAKLLEWLFNGVKGLLDRIYPDTLPQTTSAWLRDALSHYGLGNISVDRGPENFNLFFPLGDQIVLDARTYGKNDPFFWAIGAHELGHVLVYRKIPPLGWLFGLARLGHKELAKLGRVFIIANLLFGTAAINDFALSLIIGGLWCGALVLLDEALASLVALVVLRVRGKLSMGQLLGASIGLLAAFLTYVASIVADFIFYVYFDDVARRVEEEIDFVPGEALGWLATAGLIVLGIVMVWHVFVVTYTIFAKQFQLFGQHPDNLGYVCALLFLYATWDLATTPTGQALFCAGALMALPALWIPLQVAIRLLLPPLLERSRWVRNWAMRFNEKFQALAEIGLASMERSFLIRFSLWLPRVSALPYVFWYAFS